MIEFKANNNDNYKNIFTSVICFSFQQDYCCINRITNPLEMNVTVKLVGQFDLHKLQNLLKDKTEDNKIERN